MMKKASQEEAVAETFVFWDMNMCPVPAGFDPRLVRGCIKRYLEKNRYCGPLKVTAFGKLGDVPRDMLRGVYSSGIALANVPRGAADISCLIDLTKDEDLPPANYMLMSDPNAYDFFCGVYQIMYQYTPLGFTDSLESLILKNFTGEFEEEKTTGELPLWDCLVCARDPPAQGFENFTSHLDSQEHHELMSRRPNLPLPPICREIEYPEIDMECVKSDYETFVFWDINLCPVPPGFDASLVGPSIKRFLKKEGWSGPLTIIAIGLLTDIPIDMLRKLYSSGINLHNVPYGPSDTTSLIYQWPHSHGHGHINIMVISTAKIFHDYSPLLQKRFYLLEPFPNDSLQIFCVADSGALEEDDEFSETGDSIFWVCSVCDEPNTRRHGFGSFTGHLSGKKHRRKLSKLLPLSYEKRRLNLPLSEPTEVNLEEAVTAVFWDIKRCPVPHGCDPRRFGRCIKLYLEKKGYSDPLTITAFGVLTDVPIDMLRGVYSSGIDLNNGFFDCWELIDEFTTKNPPPANIVVISNAFDSGDAFNLQSKGYNLVQPFPMVSGEIELIYSTSTCVFEDSETSESALWICEVCSKDGKGFENFTTHATSRRHQRELLDCVPKNDRFLRKHGEKAKVQEIAWGCSVSSFRENTPNHG